VTARALRAVPAREGQQAAALEALVRPEFCVDLYLPTRDNAWLYGPHCSAEGCERPGNELIVDHARLCQRHAQRFKQGEQAIDEFLATAPVIAARSQLTGLPRYDLGVPQRAIQDFYGHASPEMTSHYAKLHDQALRREVHAFLDRVNRRGERVEVVPSGVAPDAVLLKERLSRAKQSLPNGCCGIPVQQTCPHPNACLSCDGFLTDETSRPVLREQRPRARTLAESAVAEGHERLAQINLADVAALDAILEGLDGLCVEPDEDFDVRDLGAA
jgi:hypothetical protein